MLGHYLQIRVAMRMLRKSMTGCDMRLSPLLALQGVFFMNAVGIALWLPRIPDVKEILGLDVWVIALCLMGAPVGTMVGFLFAARISRAMGLKRACMYSGALMCIALIFPVLASTALLLFGALVLVGFSIAIIEVAMNSKANVVQRDLGRRIMSRCHGMWSFGVMFAGLTAGAFAQAGISPMSQQILMEPLAAVLAILFAMALPDDGPRDEVEQGGFQLPKGPLLILCLVPIAALLIEGAMLDWSVLFLRTEVGMSAFEASAVFSTFAMAMGFGRLGGDWLTDRLGVSRMILGSGAAMAIGVLMFAFSHDLWLAIPAAILAGFGSANVYPLALSIAPDVPGGTPEGNVAAIALSAFTAFLLGPPLVGLVADMSSLSVSFMVLAPLGFIPALFVLTGWIRKLTGDL